MREENECFKSRNFESPLSSNGIAETESSTSFVSEAISLVFWEVEIRIDKFAIYYVTQVLPPFNFSYKIGDIEIAQLISLQNKVCCIYIENQYMTALVVWLCALNYGNFELLDLFYLFQWITPNGLFFGFQLGLCRVFGETFWTFKFRWTSDGFV